MRFGNFAFNSALAALVATLIAWSGFQTAGDSLGQAYWYQITGDEALHTEVVEVLAQTGKYSNWEGDRFVPGITTGPTLLVPSAMVSWLTGWSSARTARAFSFLYYLGSLIVLVLLLREVLLEFLIASKAPLVFTAAVAVGLYHMGYRGLHDTGYYTFGVMGEGACGFFLLLCAYLYERKDHFWAGVAAILAVFSKPVMAFLPFILLGFVVWPEVQSFLGKTRKSGVIVTRKHVMIPSGLEGVQKFPVFMTSMGLLIPLLVWLAWMVHSLGWSDTYRYWVQYPRIMRSVNGAGLPPLTELNILGLVERLQLHFTALGSLFKSRSLFFGLGGMALVLLWGRKLSGFRLLFTFSLVQLLWWFTLSPGAEARYIFPAMVGAWACFAVLGLAVLLQRAPHFEVDGRWVSGALVMTSLYFMQGVYSEWQETYEDYDSCALCRQVKVQEYWRKNSGDYSKGQAPPILYSISEGYSRDLDLVLSANHRRVVGDPSPGKDKGLFLVGEQPDSRLLSALNQNPACLPKFALSKRAIGIWECK